MKRSKRILSAILTVLMLVSAFSGFVLAVDAPTQVSNLEELVSALSGIGSTTKGIVLTADITFNADTTFSFDGENKTIIVKKGANTVTLDAKTFQPLGESPAIDSLGLQNLTVLKDLNGITVDGQGHKIIGLYTTNPAMFGSVQKNSVIKDLKFENVLVMNSTAQNVGVLAQVLYGDVSDITVEGAVVIGNEATTDYAHVGGIVGKANATALSGNVGQEKYPQIKNSTFDGYVIASNAGKNTCAGGIAAQVQGGELLNCINYGDVAVINGTRYGLGGIAGLVEAFDGANGDTVKSGRRGDNHVLNCANLGNVTDYTTNRNSEEQIGGVIGYLDLIWNANGEAHLRNLYNAGNVMRNNSTSIVKAGNGIIGKIQNPSTGTGNSGKLTDADGNAQTYRARFTSEHKGIAEYHYCDESAVVSSPVYSFSADIYSTQRISTSAVYAGLAEYYMNCNAGNIEGACAWKRENGKAVPDIGTPAKDSATPDVTKTGEIDAAEFDYVKYYNATGDDYTDDLKALFVEYCGQTVMNAQGGKVESFETSPNFWRYDKGGHLHKKSGTEYPTAMTSVKPGDWFEVTFEGTGIEWYTKYRNAMSDIAIYVDNVLVETIDGASISGVNVVGDFRMYGIYGLNSGEHTLRAVAVSDTGIMVIDYFKLYGTDAKGVKTEAREFDGYIKLDDNKHLHLFKGSTVEGFVSSHAVSYKGSCACELVDAADYDYVKYFDKDGKPVASSLLEENRLAGRAKGGDCNSGVWTGGTTSNGWTYYGASSYYQSNGFNASAKGSSFEIVFDGTGIEWHTSYRAPGSSTANIKVYIDGVPVAEKLGTEINPTEGHIGGTDHIVYDGKDFDYDRHVLRAESTSGGQFVIDYFKIIGGNGVKSTVAPEAVARLVYNATEQTGVEEGVNTCVGDDVHYTLEGAEETDAGEYTAIATLKDDGYIWSDGTTEEKTITWSIEKAPVTVTADNQSKDYGEDDPEFTVTVTGTFNEDEVTYEEPYREDEGEDIGDYEIIVTGDPEQDNYLVDYQNGTLTVGHTHTKGNDIMHNGAAHWHACGTTCPIGTTVEEYEAAFAKNEGLEVELGYEKHSFGENGMCECGRAALPDEDGGSYTTLEVTDVAYNNTDNKKTISVSFNVPESEGNPIDMSKAAKLIVYATSEDIDELVELKLPENLLEEGVDYELSYDEDTDDAIVTFDYDYKFVSIGIENSNIALNPMEFFMLDDGISKGDGDTDDDQETKLGDWITCNAVVDGALKSEFDFVFFTTTGKEFRYDSALLNSTIDGYETKYDTFSDYLDSFGNAILIDSEVLTSKYLRVAGLEQEYSKDIAFYLVAQDVGGTLGAQQNLNNTEYYRILAPITEDEAIDIECVTVLGRYGENFENSFSYQIDCAYTAYYENNILCNVDETIGAFAVIIIDGGDGAGFDGPIYVRIYSDILDKNNQPTLIRDGVLIPELY